MLCPLCFSKKTRYFAEKNSYLFYRCSDCKALFLNTLPSNIKLKDYYKKQFSYTDGLLNESLIRKRSASILNKLQNSAPKSTTLCDVGSGYGYFLDEASHRGYRSEGIEPSKQLAVHATKKYSLHIYNGGLEEYIRNTHTQFDIVTCIHVIEHVQHPKHFINLLLKLVKPGGLLFLETPNSDSHLLYREKEVYTFLIPPDHLWVFSQFSIQAMLPHNFGIIFRNTYSYSEHFMGIVKRIAANMSLRAKHNEAKQSQEVKRLPRRFTPRNDINIRKKLSYKLFDKGIAPLFTGMLNLYHKGSILELYIKKKDTKSGL